MTEEELVRSVSYAYPDYRSARRNVFDRKGGGKAEQRDAAKQRADSLRGQRVLVSQTIVGVGQLCQESR